MKSNTVRLAAVPCMPLTSPTSSSLLLNLFAARTLMTQIYISVDSANENEYLKIKAFCHQSYLTIEEVIIHSFHRVLAVGSVLGYSPWTESRVFEVATGLNMVINDLIFYSIVEI